MNAKEQAVEMANRFRGFEMTNENIASVQCALIMVDEIIKQWGYAYEYIGSVAVVKRNIADLEFWGMVKVELNKMIYHE